MAIPLFTRCAAHFSVARGVQSSISDNFHDYDVIRQSIDFPRAATAALRNCVVDIGEGEIRALRRKTALLMQPFWHRSAHTNDLPGGVALWRFRNPSTLSDPCQCAVDSLVFDESDWSRNAAAIAQNIDTLFAEHPARCWSGSDNQPRMPRLQFELPKLRLARIGDCRSSDIAMLDALARKERAVYGRESFSDAREFLQACANIIAMLPPLLRANVSIATGFEQPLSNALIQWVDARVPPPTPGALTAKIVNLGADRSVSDVGHLLFGGETANDTIRKMLGEQNGRTDSIDNIRTCFAATLSEPVESEALSSQTQAAVGWRATVRAVLYRKNDITTELARDAALFVERLFDGTCSSPVSGIHSMYHPDRTIMLVRDAPSMPAGDAAAISDSISAIEEILLLGKVIAGKLNWTLGLTALTRCAIGALRRIIIEKPHASARINASLLRSIARAPYCARIIAGMIKAGDRRLCEGLEQAVEVTAHISGYLDEVRLKIARDVVGGGPPKTRVSVTVLEPRGQRLPRSSMLRTATASGSS